MNKPEIQTKLDRHKLWLKTNGEQGDRADFRDADCRDADFRDADFRDADFRGADCRDADCRDADFRDANFRDADFRDADFRDAHFQNADFRGVDCRDADFQGANFRGANFRGVNCRRADFQGADLDFSCWPLWCGSANVIIDERQAKQLLSHAFNAGLKYWPGGLNKEQVAWLNGFHQIENNNFPRFSFDGKVEKEKNEE